MNSNMIMKSGILDILFENRNKAYGAYQLRKFYNHRIKIAMGFVMLIAVSLSAFTFFPKKVTRFTTMPFVIKETELTNVAEKPEEQVKKQETAKALTKVTPLNQKIFVNKTEIVADNVKTDSIQAINETDKIGSVLIVTATLGQPVVKPVITESGKGGRIAIPKIDKTIPVDINTVDMPPTYPGGMDALRKFLERNLHNPGEMEEGVAVSVKVKFVVDYNGKLQSFVTVQDGGEAYNKEVVRVLKKMPEWIPGKAHGENVSVYYTIPVKFVWTD